MGIAILSGPDAGALHYRIDNGEEKMIDLYTQWSSSLLLLWYLLLGNQLLIYSAAPDLQSRSI
ncbi:sialidase-1 [Pedobacter alluvionis]|nr:sialidase-1 [Pedobacter alluvionis]